ncbi:transcription regulator HTH, Myb-type, DNA-binding protein [Pochonia chlamydosporia 170]|uniref:Transcription regulator HTH, Myb-type, DNA-binding protein n=1 Tax=Pochonia chlamydosporia 170 TaxID=1380566 RepID=A0A179FTD3_METCM|nr:transcription regulator HTH, Myb-type, DNA-binding protein [Pochonia chlamydosporia 170]OAQ68279.1 transcription regulator HTH, Myb-type, DNA-binding protein [Pochonia chlamydosporia 170]
MSGQRRGPWTSNEDHRLMALISLHGAHNWVLIAQILQTRSPKQCRERYHQNLKPTLKHDPISAEEGQKIETMVERIGKRWAEISRHMSGRSDNAIKNWWNGSQNRRKRLARRRESRTAATAASSAMSSPSLSSPSSLSPSPPSLFGRTMQQARLSVVSPVLPAPRASHSISPPLFSHRNRIGSWSDDFLPSPGPSESPDSDYGINYTTSPRDQPRSLRSRQAQVELPPLRVWAENNPTEPRLPRITPEGPIDQREFERLPPLPSPRQLMTAPTSPVQQLSETRPERASWQRDFERLPHTRLQPQQPRSSRPTSDDIANDANKKMKLASLLA